jgi:glucoamylase
MHRNKGAGAWPLLNFWLSIYYACKAEITHEESDKNAAKNYYNWVLSNLGEKNHLPEQIFKKDSPQRSVSPLLWSHAMFIVASRILKYI